MCPMAKQIMLSIDQQPYFVTVVSLATSSGYHPQISPTGWSFAEFCLIPTDRFSFVVHAIGYNFTCDEPNKIKEIFYSPPPQSKSYIKMF